jgi:hypothetical protein
MALLIMRLIIFAGAKQICRDTKVTGGRKVSSDGVNNYDGTETWKNMKNIFLICMHQGTSIASCTEVRHPTLSIIFAFNFERWKVSKFEIVGYLPFRFAVGTQFDRCSNI